MEYNDLNDEQKAQVDQRVEAQAAKDSPLNSLGPAIDYYGAYTGNIEPGMVSPDYYGIKSELDQGAAQTAQLQSQAQPTTWYGQKPLARTDPALGGDTPITDAGPSPTADGKSFEEQKSTQMMRDMSAGNVDLWSKRAQFNRLTLEQRNRRRAARDHVMAETLREGWEQLNNGEGDIHKSKDGKTYRVVMYRNDGEDNPVARLNKMNANMGKKGTMTSLAVAIEVDKDGKAIGKPIIKYGYNNDGGTKATGFRDVNPAEVMNRWADTYAKRTGQSQLEARRAAVQAFGGDKNLAGVNPAGWDIAPTAQEIAAEGQRKADEKLKLERDKIDNQNAQFYASLGFDREKLAQTSAQFDKNYDLALKQFDASEKHANAADDISGRRQDLAEKQFDEQVKQTIRGANREDMKLAYEIVTGLQNAGKGMTTGDILKSMGDDTIEQFYKIPMVNPDGTPVTDANGAQMFRPPQTKEEYDRCTEGLVNAVNALRGANGGASIRDNYAKLTAVRDAISGEPSTPAGGSSTGGAILTPAGQLGGARGGGSQSVASQYAAQALRQRQAQDSGAATSATQENDATAGASAQSGAGPLPPLVASTTQAQAQQPTQAAPSAPEQKPTRQFDEEQLRKRRNGIKADFVRRYKTVQDVAREVVRTLNANGELDSIVNPDGTRRTDLTPQEESDIIYNMRKKFRDAGMSDFWDREVAGISPNSPGGLTRKAILDRLFRDWNNMKAPLEYGNRRIQAQ